MPLPSGARLGLLCLAIAAAAYGTLQLTLGPVPADIHVRWAPGVSETTRAAKERTFTLSEGQPLDGRTWAYILKDTSSTNVRALVGDAAVEDTADIDRARFRVSRTSTAGHDAPALHPWISTGLWVLSALCLVAGLVGVGRGLIDRFAPRVLPAWRLPRQAGVVPLLPGQRRLALLLLGVLVALDVSSMRHMTITFDEPEHLQYGQDILRFKSARSVDSTMPISALNAVPSALSMRMPAGPLTSFLAQPETGRYVTVLVSLLVALCVFAWARDLYGANAGLLALTLYTFDPNLLAHSQLITTDLFAVGTITFALYFFWRFLHQGGWQLGVWSALTLGLAAISKYSAAVLFPLCAAIAVGFHARAVVSDLLGGRVDALGRRVLRFFGVALAFGLVSLMVINAGFLFNRTLTPLDGYRFQSDVFRSLQSSAGVLGAVPLPIPYPYLEGLDAVMEHERSGSSFGRIYLLGELREGRGFAGYYFYASLYKLPLATQFLLLAAGVTYVLRRRRFDFLRNESVLLVPVLFFTVYFNFFYRAQIGIRYFLVVFPLLYVFSGSLLAGREALPRRAVAGLSVAVGSLILSVLSYYPHFLPYFNELVWHRTQAYTVLADSNIDWGQDGWYLDRYIAAHPDAIVEPGSPTAGTILVRVNALTGVLGDPERFRWLREHFTPIDHVAHAVLVYSVSETDLERIGPR